MKNKKTLMTVAAIVIAGGCFYGGMLYGKSTSTPQFGNLSAAQRQQFAASGFTGRTGTNGTGTAGGGAVAGQIISSDVNSMTVKMSDGSSKIVFFSTSTKISKSADGTAKDLFAQENVIISGQTNPDGSVTAQTIQIRPLTQQQ